MSKILKNEIYSVLQLINLIKLYFSIKESMHTCYKHFMNDILWYSKLWSYNITLLLHYRY